MSKKMIVLKSSDGELFEIEEAVALQSQRIAHMVEDEGADNVIPLENVTSQVLKKVIEYCKKHVHVDGGNSFNMLATCTVDESRTLLGVENDYTPEEEEAVRKENQWAFK